MRIRISRIRGSSSGNSGSGSDYGSDLKSNKFQFFLSIFFSEKDIILTTMFFIFYLWAYYSCLLNKKGDFSTKIYSYNFGWFLCEFITIVFVTTRIRIHVSWSGSGSGQMIRIRPDPESKHWLKRLNWDKWERVPWRGRWHGRTTNSPIEVLESLISH